MKSECDVLLKMISVKCQLRSLSIASAKCSTIILSPSVSDSEIAVLERIIFYFRNASGASFLVLFCSWSPDIGENALTADYDLGCFGSLYTIIGPSQSICLRILT